VLKPNLVQLHFLHIFWKQFSSPPIWAPHIFWRQRIWIGIYPLYIAKRVLGLLRLLNLPSGIGLEPMGCTTPVSPQR
jgi:hypothetical protein